MYLKTALYAEIVRFDMLMKNIGKTYKIKMYEASNKKSIRSFILHYLHYSYIRLILSELDYKASELF